MTAGLDRRRFLVAGGLGAAALSLPAWARFGSGFTHGVASGEPAATSVLLWTRFVTSAGITRLTAELSETDDFARIVGGGTATADPQRDHTARIVARGLHPDRWYHYRFVAPDGTRSPIGRTRTLPVDRVARFGLGVFSCANLPFGWFNAYAHAAARRDLDLAVHTGDYLYEYPRGTYPSASDTVAGRVIEPAGETILLADYRLRHASYRADRDLQALHAAMPMIAMWDDHESANDSWEGGAENHDAATEGDWRSRKRAAVQAYRDWMPVSDADWAEYRIGDLATLFRIETRLHARSQQLSFAAAIKDQADIERALRAFRDDAWMDPSRTMMGRDQEAWLAAALKRAGHDTRWQIVAQQVNVGFEYMPPETATWVPDAAPAAIRQGVAIGSIAAKLGLPHNLDNWNGYPAARSRLLRAALDADARLIILSGDSHNAFAYDLKDGKDPAGVEFGGHSVTSPGYESYFPATAPGDVANALRRSSPELRWADTARRGYMTVDLTRESASAEWLFADTITRPSRTIADTHRESVAWGRP